MGSRFMQLSSDVVYSESRDVSGWVGVGESLEVSAPSDDDEEAPSEEHPTS